MTHDFSNVQILVVGDLMLDQYLTGQVDRISPEAPVPVLKINKENANPGGAANVAMNLAGLKVKVKLFGATGEDFEKQKLEKLCSEAGVQCHFWTSQGPTITKTRLMGSHQQMMRLDREEPFNWSPSELIKAQTQILALIKDCQGLIISDYGKGLCSPAFCKEVIGQATDMGIPIFVDPKGKDWQKYTGADFVTPNFKEFCEHLGQVGENSEKFIKTHAPQITRQGFSKNLLITRSEKGMTLWSDSGATTSPARAREVFDVSGAGDTVIATFAAAYCAKLPTNQCLDLANRAAGVVVGLLGTTPISISLLNSEDKSLDSISLEDLKLEMQNRQGQKAIFTNGCFDLLHRGHLEYLKKARELGDYLIVGLNSDQSVSKLKGPDRPVNNEQDRAALLSALAFVDYVVIFEEDTPLNLLQALKPQVLVKGGDYTLDQVIGKECVEEVVLIDFVEGYSSTRIIQKMRKTH